MSEGTEKESRKGAGVRGGRKTVILSLSDVIVSNFPSGCCGFKWSLTVKSSEIPQRSCLCPTTVRFSQILRAAS